MITPNAAFHWIAYQLIAFFEDGAQDVWVADCKPGTPDTVEDNRTDFTLKAVQKSNEHLLCYIVFRMTSFASVTKFDKLSNIKLYDFNWPVVVHQYNLEDYTELERLYDDIVRRILSLKI